MTEAGSQEKTATGAGEGGLRQDEALGLDFEDTYCSERQSKEDKI